MIAMQYSIVLPADYDMNIIKQRIAAKGHLLDDFPGLIFKAYLTAGKNIAPAYSQDNLYAPFYLWQDSEAMNRFLGGEMFAGLAQAFGRPVIKTWSVWEHDITADIAGARFATREMATIAPYASLRETRERESAALQASSKNGALGAVSAYEPTGWTSVRLNFWADIKDEPVRNDVQRYEIGHLSLPPLRDRKHA
jgi:hypothetical protein